MSLKSAAEQSSVSRTAATDFQLVCELRGHTGRITNLCWGSDSRHLMTVSDDSKIHVWDALEQTKLYTVRLPSSRVIAAGFSPGMKLVGTGGLDNLVTLYQVKDAVYRGSREEFDEKECSTISLSGHEGYVMSFEFWEDQKLVSASGDKTAKLWDVAAARAITTFSGHAADVLYASGIPAKSLLLTSSSDKTVKLWDTRTSGESTATFEGHTADVNSVRWFSNGFTFVTASEDDTCRVWDIRAGSTISTVNLGGRFPTFADCSLSGKYLFASHSDGKLSVWSTLFGDLLQEITVSEAESNRVNCCKLSPDGRAFAAPCFDSVARVFA